MLGRWDCHRWTWTSWGRGTRVQVYTYDEESHEDAEPVDDTIRAIISRGPRSLCVMQQVLPGFDTDNLIDVGRDPIIEANELREKGAYGEAQHLLHGSLEADLRRLDAHAHLGSMAFDNLPRQPLDHYAVGVKIGELALGDSFQGVLSWQDIDNRLLLRCLHGHGLCLWKLERFEDGLDIDRTSSTRIFANQFRGLLTLSAYILFQELRPKAKRTRLTNAQVSTLRKR